VRERRLGLERPGDLRLTSCASKPEAVAGHREGIADDEPVGAADGELHLSGHEHRNVTVTGIAPSDDNDNNNLSRPLTTLAPTGR
jgi:hypothetical protein